MTTRNLRRIGRRLKPKVKALRFDRGTVLEIIDASHVRVFLDASRQPITWVPDFLRLAIGVDQEVMVRTAGSTYAIDSIISGSLARMLTVAEIAALFPAGNLIPNPSPTSLTGWSSTSTHADPDHLVTDYWPADSTDESSFEAWSADASFDVFPVPSGTGGCAVTAGTTYSGSARVLNWYGTDAAYGVVWSDSGGSTISTDTDTAVSFAPDGTWMYLGSPSPEGDEKGCVPTGSFTAPPGAAFARPFIHVTQPIPGGAYYRHTNVALFDLHAGA